MKTKIGLGIVVALCIVASTTAVIADIAPLAMLQVVQIVSQRIDRLQKRADKTTFGSDVYAYAHIDGVSEPQPGIVAVSGWGFGCGYVDARVALVVDDIEVGGTPTRPPRPDVNALYAGTCNVVGDTGVIWFVDMALFEPGFTGNHLHTFKFRVYPPTWPTVVPFAMIDSAPVAFYSW